MITLHRLATSGLALACCLALAPGLRAQTTLGPMDLSFLPPDYAPREICGTTSDDLALDDLTRERGSDELTDPFRVRFLKRDIARLQRDDAARFFEFIRVLLDRRAELDPDFSGVDAMFAAVRLHLAAGRADALLQGGLIPALTDQVDSLGGNQLLALAQYYQNGIGTTPDAQRANALTLEAAYKGHPRALLEIVRLNRLGTPLDGWDAPMDLTLAMAFGGILGGMTPGLCQRAEIIASEYLRGDVVRRDPETALAWRRFAADMGGAEASWRVVEFHLNARADRKDNAELRRYLKRAVDLGLVVDEDEQGRVLASGAVSHAELEKILGHNESQNGVRNRGDLAALLDLSINLDGRNADEDGLYLKHLREISQLPDAPGRIFVWLATEVAVMDGRWAGEPEILTLLEEAVRRGDELGMQALAGRLIRYRDDPVRLARAENLLLETVSQFGMESSMHKLDGLYRCQANDAPRLAEAEHWARAYRASGHAAVTISGTDLIALDPFKDPEAIARIQSQALEGRSTVLAQHTERLLSDGLATQAAMRIWADRLDNSAQALEVFAELEFELATSPMQRTQAVELFRRIYLYNGITTALDLAIALVEDNARDPEIAAEVVDLLTRAGHRGEGAAIRLLSRVQAGDRTAAEVYAEFADDIEDRGDFLAMMFAIPFIPASKVDDYADRAVSLMTCGTKDADEMGDAYAIRDDMGLSYHWRQIGLHFEGGHVLSKLRLSNPQMAMFDVGAAPDADDVAARLVADGAPHAHRQAFWQAANPDLRSYDPLAAADLLNAAFERPEERAWAVSAWRKTGPAIREIVAEAHDIRGLSRASAEAGNSAIRFEHAMLLRDDARGAADLAESVTWLTRAAEAGHSDAMVELGFALAFGLGVASDDAAALQWLDRASADHNDRADSLAALIRSRAAP